jgi:hypothetical protein
MQKNFINGLTVVYAKLLKANLKPDPASRFRSHRCLNSSSAGSESQSLMVFCQARFCVASGRSTCNGDARFSRAPSLCCTPVCHGQRLYGRTLAGRLCHTTAERIARFGAPVLQQNGGSYPFKSPFPISTNLICDFAERAVHSDEASLRNCFQ